MTDVATEEIKEAPTPRQFELSQASERRMVDLKARNQKLLERIIDNGAKPSTTAVLVARIKALLTLSSNWEQALDVAEGMTDNQLVANAVESLVQIQRGADPGRVQAFDLAFEENINKLLEDINTEVNKVILAAGEAQKQTRSGLILP